MRHCPDVFVFFQITVKYPLFKGVFIQFCLLTIKPPSWIKTQKPLRRPFNWRCDSVLTSERLVILRNPTLFAFLGSARLQ